MKRAKQTPQPFRNHIDRRIQIERKYMKRTMQMSRESVLDDTAREFIKECLSGMKHL